MSQVPRAHIILVGATGMWDLPDMPKTSFRPSAIIKTGELVYLTFCGTVTFPWVGGWRVPTACALRRAFLRSRPSGICRWGKGAAADVLLVVETPHKTA